MSVGFGLLRCMLDNNVSFSLLDEHGIDRKVFIGDEVRVYDMMRRHVERHGVLPELETILVETRVTLPPFPNEPIGFWVEQILYRRHAELIMLASREMEKDILEGNLDQAKKLVADLYMRLGETLQSSKVFDFKEVAPSIVESHDRLQRLSHTMSGIPFGIEYLDAISGGAQPADTIALVGRPSAGKSYFLARMSLNCYERGGVPFVVSLEMPVVQWVRRLLALRANITATSLRLGRLSFWARKKLVENVGDLLEMKDKPFYLMEGTLTSTVDDIALRLREIRPSALYVDGAYLLRLKGKPLSRWERVTETAEWLKMIANEFHIPVIGTYQFNRRGPGQLEHIGYSDAIGQLASIVIGLDDDERHAQERLGFRQYKIMELLKGREGETGTIRVIYDMQRMIIQQDTVIRGVMLSKDSEEKDA